MASIRDACEWTVDSIGVHPDGRVVLCSKDGCAGQDFGRLAEIVKERDELREKVRLVKEGMADRNRLFEQCIKLGEENDRLKEEIANTNTFCNRLFDELGEAKAKGSRLEAEVERLKAGIDRPKPDEPQIACGEMSANDQMVRGMLGALISLDSNRALTATVERVWQDYRTVYTVSVGS